MRLLSIPANYPGTQATDIGGIFIHRQFRALKARGWDIRVIHTQLLGYHEYKGTGQYFPFHSERDGIQVWRPRCWWIPRLVIGSGTQFERLYDRAVQRVLPEVTRDWKPDVVVADWFIPTGLAASHIAERFDIPLILRARGQDVRLLTKELASSKGARDYYRKMGQRAQRILCQGDGLYQQLKETGIFDTAKMFTITNGIDTELFAPASESEKAVLREKFNIPADAQVWFFAGRWEVPKGVREMAAALQNLLPRFPNVYFVAAGSIRDQTTRQALEKVSDRVRFLGTQEPSSMAALYRMSDVLMLPSYQEGMPNAVLEAMACGLVCIVTPVGGVPYILKDGENGFIIETRSAESLEAALATCAGDLERYRRLGAAGRQTIIEQGHDLATVASSLDEMFRGISVYP